MNVSSVKEREQYPTPEFRNLLTTTKRLRREISRLGTVGFNKVSYNRLLKGLDSLEESLDVHFKEIYDLERTLVDVASTHLTEKQKKLLIWITENHSEDAIYTTLIELMSEKLGIPRSTVRWNLRRLREKGIISAGDKMNKGIPVRLTEKGQIVVEYIELDVF